MFDLLRVLAVVLSVLTIISDLYERRVRNIWLLVTLLLGAGWMGWAWIHGMAGPPWTAARGLVIGLLALLPMYVMGWMGAGDVKFFATVGFLLGGKALLAIWMIASVLGGLHAAIILLSRRWIPRAGLGVMRLQVYVEQSRGWQRILMARQGRNGLPYAAYMAMGALFTIYVPTLTRW